jgi:uncharacterized membrane-anchored protein YjiN (DUF445 family)
VSVVLQKPVLALLGLETAEVAAHHPRTMPQASWFSWLATVATAALLGVMADARALPCPVCGPGERQPER